jgi:putative hemolysin
MQSHWIEIIVIVAMLVLNAVFAAYEMALAAVSRARLLVLCEQKRRGAESARLMKNRLEASLAVVQLGITVAGAIAAATGGLSVAESLAPMLEQRFGWRAGVADFVGLVAFIVPLSFITIVFSELVPKVLALQNREAVLLWLSGPMRALSVGLSPVVVLFEKSVRGVVRLFGRPHETEEQRARTELLSAAARARALKLIGPFEERIVNAAAALAIKPVGEAAIPREDICLIPADFSLADALIRAHTDLHTRFPVAEKDGATGTIIGYVNFKDIVSALRINPATPTVLGIMRPLRRFPASLSAAKALEQMIAEGAHMALVENPHGTITGMVTLEDIIEELVGEIEDEYDRLPAYIAKMGEGLLAGGGTNMRDIYRVLGRDWPGNPQSLARWIGRAAPTAVAGDTIKLDGLSVWIRKQQRKKPAEALITPL